jgi:hypothetical protein
MLTVGGGFFPAPYGHPAAKVNLHKAALQGKHLCPISARLIKAEAKVNKRATFVSAVACGLPFPGRRVRAGGYLEPLPSV